MNNESTEKENGKPKKDADKPKAKKPKVYPNLIEYILTVPIYTD